MFQCYPCSIFILFCFTLRTKDKIEPQYIRGTCHYRPKKAQNLFPLQQCMVPHSQKPSACARTPLFIIYQKTNSMQFERTKESGKNWDNCSISKCAYMIFVLKFKYIRSLKVHNDIYSPTELELPFFLSFWRAVLFKSTTAGVVLDETCASFCPLLFLI